MGRTSRESVGQVKTTVSLNFKLFIFKILQNSLIGTDESGIKFLGSMHFLLIFVILHIQYANSLVQSCSN